MFQINNTYNIFISHSWEYHNDYDKIMTWLRNSNIQIRDYSISTEKALPLMSKTALKANISEKIRHASVVIILAGMYAAYSDWIDYEIDEAVRMGKPILGVIPWGQQRIPSKISANSTCMVYWNSESIVKRVKSLL